MTMLKKLRVTHTLVLLYGMIVPTNAVLMGILGICGIPYGRWFRFISPLMIQLLILGSLTMALAAMIGYQ